MSTTDTTTASAAGSVKKSFSVALDIAKSISNREFSVVEGDTGNILNITLNDNGSAVDLSGCRVLALFSKSNGETVCQDSAEAEGGVSIGGENMNEISIELFPSSTAPGMVESEIQIYSGSDLSTLITTAQFNFKCRRGILNADTLTATKEYPILIELITQNRQMQAELEKMLSEMQTIHTAEARRVQAEKIREYSETKREHNEASRMEMEEMRMVAEEERYDAEVERQTHYEELCEEIRQSWLLGQN